MTRLDLTSPSNHRRLLQQHAPKPPFVPRLAQSALNQYLGGYIREGGFSLIYPDGEQYYYGQSWASQPGPTLHFTSWDDITALAANPSLGFGLAYSNGRIIHADESDLTGFLEAMFANRRYSKVGSMLAQLRRRPLNHQARQTRNIAAHYDQAAEQWWFDRVLGPTESYTCARFTSGEESLDEAQIAKMLNVAAKLGLTDERDRPLDQRSQILEVGSGWGYMACLLAQRFGVKVTGVTIAAGQVKASIERAKAMGVTQLVEFRLVGYQKLPELLADGTIGQFDATYSIGMLEHVPHSEYQEYFRILAMITKPGAPVFIHCITNRLGGAPDAFVSRVVFPGSRLGSVAQISQVAARAGLVQWDYENLRFHYVRTLQMWIDNHVAAKAEIVAKLGISFYLMRYYWLVASMVSFASGELNLSQFIYTNGVPAMDARPLSRSDRYDQPPA